MGVTDNKMVAFRIAVVLLFLGLYLVVRFVVVVGVVVGVVMVVVLMVVTIYIWRALAIVKVVVYLMFSYDCKYLACNISWPCILYTSGLLFWWWRLLC